MGVVMPAEGVVRIPAAWLADAARRADGGPAQDPETGFQFLSGSHAGNSWAERSPVCRQHASHSRPAVLASCTDLTASSNKKCYLGVRKTCK